MSNLWVHAARRVVDLLPTSGVLHGTDADGGHYDFPYHGDQRAMLEHAKRMQAANPGVRFNEATHPGSCDEAGCKFYEKWRDGRQAYTNSEGRAVGGYTANPVGIQVIEDTDDDEH
jgi:hypothetical protein